MTEINNPEFLESAAPRDFVVAMRTKDGFKSRKADRQLVVVKAYSIFGAKMAAIKRVRKGKHTHTTMSAWIFDSVEDAANQKEIITGEENVTA